LHDELDELQEAGKLMQSDKLACIGQLAAGVAHEINNPISFVHSNLGTLEKYHQDILLMLQAYEKAEPLLAADAKVAASLKELREKLDIDFIKLDLTALTRESLSGILLIKNIVQNLKDFSHVGDADEWQYADLHQGLNSTLNIFKREIKHKGDVIKEYGDIPEVECLPAQLNQVFMSMLLNAAQSIEKHGTITLRTGKLDDEVWMEISDTGKGIAPEHIKKIFDPFFTTKPIGKGTGLGLSRSYGIVHKHHGRIEVRSSVGKGSTFKVWLPIRHVDYEQ